MIFFPHVDAQRQRNLLTLDLDFGSLYRC